MISPYVMVPAVLAQFPDGGFDVVELPENIQRKLPEISFTERDGGRRYLESVPLIVEADHSLQRILQNFSRMNIS